MTEPSDPTSSQPSSSADDWRDAPLPASVMAEVQRILDRAARERLAMMLAEGRFP
jgi:hypothetical protein